MSARWVMAMLIVSAWVLALPTMSVQVAAQMVLVMFQSLTVQVDAPK
jgi:hypothetical protein